MGRSYKFDEEQALEYVSKRVDPRGIESYRRSFEQGWLRYAAFYNGKQNFIQDGVRMRNPSLPPHRVLYQADFISGAVSSAVAKVLSNRISFASPPRDGTRKSRESARVSKRLFDHLRESTDWDELQEIAWTWAAIAGSGFQQIVWDPLAGPVDRFFLEDGRGKKVSVGLTPEEQKAKELAGHFEDHPQGAVSVLNWNPFQFHWDSRARERGIHDCRWVATRQLVDIEELEDYWGYAATKDIKPMDTDSQATYFEEVLAFMASGFNSPLATYAIPKDKRGNQTILTQILERPSATNGKMGRQVAVAGDSVLYNGPNPYRILEGDVPGGSLPFLKYDWQIRAGAFVGLGLVERLTSPQFQYNRSRSVATEHQNIYGHPSMFVPKGSDIPTGHLTIQPGMVYEYQARAGVKPVETGPVPLLAKEVSENASRALQEMKAISSQADPDMGNLPGSIRGAPALEMMIEEKNKVLMPTSKRVVRNTVFAGRIMLAMCKKLYTGRQMMRYVGADNQMRIMYFQASDISSDLVVVGEPGYFHSAASERAKILEYVQVGVLNPQDPDDKASILKALAFGTADEAIQERLADEENQEAEIEEMLDNADKYLGVGPQGPQAKMPTQPFDDDRAHARVLRRFLKSSEAKRLHPLQKELLVAHLQEHQQKIQQQMQQQLAMIEAQKGSPGEKGKPSQPTQRSKQA